MILKLNKYGEEILIKPQLAFYNATDFMGEEKKNLAVALTEVNKEGQFVDNWSVLTVNFGEFLGAANSAYIDVNNNGKEILSWKTENNLGVISAFTKQSGFVEYPLCIFHEEFLKEIDEEDEYEEYLKQYDFGDSDDTDDELE